MNKNITNNVAGEVFSGLFLKSSFNPFTLQQIHSVKWKTMILTVINTFNPFDTPNPQFIAGYEYPSS